jgi:hypothetical protein
MSEQKRFIGNLCWRMHVFVGLNFMTSTEIEFLLRY